MSNPTSPRVTKPVEEDLPAEVMANLSLEEQSFFVSQMYRLIVGKKASVIWAPKKVVLQSKKLAKCVEQIKPQDDQNTLILAAESPHEIAFVLEYLTDPTKPTGLVKKAMRCPDDIGEDDVEKGPAPFTHPAWQYIWGTQHGLDKLCAQAVELYKHAFSNPWTAPDKHWDVLKELLEDGLGDSELSNTLLEGKAWQMRFFGPKDMPRYYEDLIGHPELMFKVMTALSGVNMKQCPGGDQKSCAWHNNHGPNGEIDPEEEVLGKGLRFVKMTGEDRLAMEASLQGKRK
ncbi:hypothetical protein H2200_011681 [Cladophialophora chaetospira]|uniref:Uncharacterized protein n=1 Tax=Cladophialophora chaetospira TaxID=386627 RepID=A0AA38WZT9_9EURO|nr:hypothetical protein H2200_011681 [Cladophialophora chaetospira]